MQSMFNLIWKLVIQIDCAKTKNHCEKFKSSVIYIYIEFNCTFMKSIKNYIEALRNKINLTIYCTCLLL